MRENVEMLARMPKNEAECRLNVNKLFMYCLKEERQALATAPNPPPYLPAFTLEPPYTWLLPTKAYESFLLE